MIGAEDRLRARADEIKVRMDEIDATANAREEDTGVHTDVELAEYEKLTAELEGLGRKMAAVERGRKARTADWLDRSGLNEPGELADGISAGTFEDGARIVEDATPKFGFGDMLQFTMQSGDPSAQVNGDLQRAAAATGVEMAVGSEGGFLMQPEFSNIIWDGMNQDPNSLLDRTDQFTITGESLTFPANSETSRANGSRWGGVRGYWLKEADQITSSRPKFRQVKIEPNELAVLVYATDKSLRNNPTALEQYISRSAASELNFMIGDAIINGDGSGKPQGILNSDSLVTVAKETGQLAATLEAENIDKMFARLHPNARANAVWLHNTDIEPQLSQLNFAVGTSGQLVYMPPGGISGAPFSTLKGRPMIPIEYAATLGTVGDLILCDLSGYITGTKGGVQSAMSMHIRFDYAESVFRFMFEIDGQPWLNSAITPFKGSDTLSTHVALATRA